MRQGKRTSISRDAASSSGSDGPRVVALSGGVGGAKLALGLYRLLGNKELTIVVNTGDDFEHLGLHISPDIDSVLYALAGVNNPEVGWGRRDETWNFMAELKRLGGETWFRLGDRDLAIHVERTRRLRAGESLTHVTMHFTRRLGLTAAVLPMSDDPVRTFVLTDEGRLALQEYFVARRSMPHVSGFVYEGAATARPSAEFLAFLRSPALRALVICPSNPFLSVEPILALPGVREAVRFCRAPVIAVSSIIGGKAVKGPTAKIMGELDLPPTAAAVAHRYGDLLDGYVLDEQDAACAKEIAVPVVITRTLMNSLEDRVRLARDVLAFADQLARAKGEAVSRPVPVQS